MQSIEKIAEAVPTAAAAALSVKEHISRLGTSNVSTLSVFLIVRLINNNKTT